MDPRSSPPDRRNAAPAAAGVAPRSSERDGKRSMLGSFKDTFRKANFPDLILDSQVKAFSRLRGLKTRTIALGRSRDGGGRIKSSLLRPLLPSPPKGTPLSSTSPLGPPDYASAVASGVPETAKSQPEEPMHPPVLIASQKRKHGQEHEDAPSRTKAKSRAVADDPEKRHIVQEWVNQQDEPVSPTALPGVGVDDSFPPSVAPPVMDDNHEPPVASAISRRAANIPGTKWLNREFFDTFLPHRPSRELVESILHHRSNAAPQSEAQGVTSSAQPCKGDERRGSTATTSNLTYRDSIFSSCPSVATGLTSPSEISLALTGRRVQTDSRSSSFFGKPSPRSSIASTSPSPQFVLYRTMSSNAAGRFDDAHDLAQHPLPNVPRADPLRSHPTFFGMDLRNAQNAVVIDQVVKMGHCAQERRINNKVPLFDAAQLLVAPSASAPKELTPITETASDDGVSSARKLQMHGQGSAEATNGGHSSARGDETPGSDAVRRSNPSTPESGPRLSDDMGNGDATPQNQTPATSVTAVSNATLGEVPSNVSDESDDSASDITDYTEDSLFEAVEAFGPGLSNPLLLSIILTFKDDVLRLILARIITMLGDNNGTTQHTNGANPGSSGGPSSSNDSLQEQTPGSQRKRERDGDRSGSEGDEGDDRGKRPKTVPAIPTDLETRYKRLACPFFKRFPDRKWKKACCGPGFKTVHRMKEHVYRTHDHPYCQRCHETFADEKGLEEHAKAETQCIVAQGPMLHRGITRKQRESLKSRKKANKDAVQTEADLWVEVYILLFPEVPRGQIPSPYSDVKSYQDLLTSDSTIAAVRQLFEDELPTRITDQLRERLRPIPGAQSDYVQAQLPDLVRTCIQEVLSNLPPQLLSRGESMTPFESRTGPSAAAMDGPDSHGTAQVGSQFASMEPPPPPLPPIQAPASQHGQESIAELTLPDSAQPWAAFPPPDLHDLGAPFRGVWFPNPLAPQENTNPHVSMPGSTEVEQPIYYGATATTGFAPMGIPSAMLGGTPFLSPALLPQQVGAVDECYFAAAAPAAAAASGGSGGGGGGGGLVTFREALTNLPNTTFMFTTQVEQGQKQKQPSPGETMWQEGRVG